MSGHELGPSWDMHMMIASLRTDHADVASYARVLTETLGDALPADMVKIDYRRSMGDRVSGRQGSPVAVRVYGAERRLELRRAETGTRAEIHAVVRDVVISRKEVTIEQWLAALAEELRTLASRDEAARTALARLLDP